MLARSLSRIEVKQGFGRASLRCVDNRAKPIINRRYTRNFVVEPLRAQSLGWSPGQEVFLGSELEAEVDALLAEISNTGSVV